MINMNLHHLAADLTFAIWIYALVLLTFLLIFICCCFRVYLINGDCREARDLHIGVIGAARAGRPGDGMVVDGVSYNMDISATTTELRAGN